LPTSSVDMGRPGARRRPVMSVSPSSR
jgi:hypothetical protein